MRIKKLFKTECEYLDYVWSFINFDENKIWREEDLPKLQPFFDFTDKHRGNSHKLNDEEKQSFDYCQKCKQEYADKLFEIRDSIYGFSVDELTEFFLLQHTDMNCYDTDEDGNIIPPLSRETLKISEDWKDEMTFPLVFVGMISSSFDRYGDVRMAFSEFVSLKEFN